MKGTQNGKVVVPTLIEGHQILAIGAKGYFFSNNVDNCVCLDRCLMLLCLFHVLVPFTIQERERTKQARKTEKPWAGSWHARPTVSFAGQRSTKAVGDAYAPTAFFQSFRF